jgi:hypothetical protein
VVLYAQKKQGGVNMNMNPPPSSMFAHDAAALPVDLLPLAPA